MDPVSLVPAPDALPVHWLWLQLFLTVTTFLHLVAMNVLLGSGYVAFVSSFTRKEGAHILSKKIGEKLPFVLAFTINFGVAPLLFLQTLYGQFFYTSTVLMASYWMAIVGLLIVTYYAAYVFHLRFDALAHLRTFVIGFAFLLLLVISFFFTNNISLMQMPESWSHYFANRNGWLVNYDDATLFPRYLHFVVSGIAVGSLAVAVLYDYKKKRGDAEAVQWVKQGCRWFSIATGVNFGIGFWFLGTLPPSTHDASTFVGMLFAVVLYGSIASAAVSLVKAMTYRVISAAIWTLLTVFLMVVARDLVRISYLKPFLSLSDLPVTPQYSPFVLFIVFFVGVGFLVRWLLRVACKSKEVNP